MYWKIHRFASVQGSFYNDSLNDGFVIVYDVTDKESFEAVNGYRDKINERRPNVPILLVGNKSDLSTKRKVSPEEGKEFAEEHNMLFAETSAKNDEYQTLQKAFTELARKMTIYRADNPRPVSESKKEYDNESDYSFYGYR